MAVAMASLLSPASLSTSLHEADTDEGGEYEDDASLAEFLESEVLGDGEGLDSGAIVGEEIGKFEVPGGGDYHLAPGDDDDDDEHRGKTWLPHSVHQLASLKALQMLTAGACAAHNRVAPECLWASLLVFSSQVTQEGGDAQLSIQTGSFGRVPPELFQNILKFLSSEDLSTCTSVCRFLRGAASDEGLWRKLYCLRWGLPPGQDRRGKPRGSAWKKLYFERDEADMVDFVRNTPAEFREYYIQMQAAKRSQAPQPSQVQDDLVVVDTSMADEITAWRRNQRLADVYTGAHWCSGRTCSYYQIGDVFLCEKTGRAHVCDDTCREIVLDPSNELLVCTVSGRCFDRWLTPAEEDEAEPGQQQAEANAAAEEGEPFLGTGRLARAYLLGYNCADEHELDDAIREVMYPSSKRSKLCYSGCS